ncbi:MAG: 5-amino-6-(D-ribitylamino)uracil--L-tyrosine 4-hydroxyphenyl transferase CofH [Aestuariibacter sp.]
MTWCILPLKKPEQSKSRLSRLLNQEQRQALVSAMAQDVINALASTGEISRLLVVTQDRDYQHLTSPDLAIEFLSEPSSEVNEIHSATDSKKSFAPITSPSSDRFNQALSAAVVYARSRGAANVLITHADIPQLQSAAAQAWLAGLKERARKTPNILSAVKCKNGKGTNMLFLGPEAPVQLCFGENSFTRFQQTAQQTTTTFIPGIVAGGCFDIDTKDDFKALQIRLSFRRDTVTAQQLNNGWGDCDYSTSDARELHDSLRTKSLRGLQQQATALLNQHPLGNYVSYSPKVFIPLTQLCRNTCRYCTYANHPIEQSSSYISVEKAISVAQEGLRKGCKEVLIVAGDRPELRYTQAKDFLEKEGFTSTVDYASHLATVVRKKTGMLVHFNLGVLTASELAKLRPVAASMGFMMESVAESLALKGQPHYACPDKSPLLRLRSLVFAGEQHIPMTTGLLVGIGESKLDRIETLLCIKQLHEKYGHIQEVIIQNFIPKANTGMAHAKGVNTNELCETIAIARLILGPEMNIQAPPNLSDAKALTQLLASGINDLGGVSPVTQDYVNPENAWPAIKLLSQIIHSSGKNLIPRLTIYPEYALEPGKWLDKEVRTDVLRLSDSRGLAKEDNWETGRSETLPQWVNEKGVCAKDRSLAQIISKCQHREALSPAEVAKLFDARGDNFAVICEASDQMRQELKGDQLTFVNNGNINYTNICYFSCGFCAFSKGNRFLPESDPKYKLSVDQVVQKAATIIAKGATELCLQGGIHPSYTGDTYLEIIKQLRSAFPDIHLHGFSPLEIVQGADTLGITPITYLEKLKSAGLNTIPGTAAEILVDRVREQICPKKLSTKQWMSTIESAHLVGLKSTATIMFGHVDNYHDWAEHLLLLRQMQCKTEGFTEFVPLPFVPHQAPIYRKGLARKGPSLRESILMHAVSRLIFASHIDNIQASITKLGEKATLMAINSGANDLGGTLQNENISRAAGASHGENFTSNNFQKIANLSGRTLIERNTLYKRTINKQSNRLVVKEV